MGDLAKVLTAGPMRRGVPTAFTSGASYAPTGELIAASVNVREIPEDEAGWRKEIEAQTGITVPEGREVVLTGVRLWGNDATQNRHLTFKIVDRSVGLNGVDLDALAKLARGNAKRKPLKATERALTQTRLIGLTDEQLHKVDRHGGTPEFFERIGAMLNDLDDELRREPCEDAVLLLGGDLIEGFESTGSQAHTNDGSHPTQIVTAHGYLIEVITRIASRFNRVRVLAVPSNHAAWRKGKDYLGKPGDDYGLAIVKMVATALAMDERWSHVEFIIPGDWEVSCAVQVRDDVVALTHGHIGNTFTPEGFKRWFLQQVAGDSPIAQATIVVSGHYHHRRVWPLGNLGDRERVHIQLPALDGGSSWFTNATGDWSHPGIWTAVVRDGYGLDHERVLRTVR